MFWHKNGFSTTEAVGVCVLIGLVMVVFSFVLDRVNMTARDAGRKMEISQIGRIICLPCLMPEQGAGTYDLAEIAGQLKLEASFKGSYRYTVVPGGAHCVLYGNLENQDEPANLGNTSSKPGGGIGIFQALQTGENGSDKYFQVSN